MELDPRSLRRCVIRLRNYALAISMLTASSCGAPGGLRQSLAPDLVIAGAVVIDVMAGEYQHSNIIIDDGVILTLEPPRKGDLTTGAEKIYDARGLYAIPGLWDMHVHLTYDPELTPTIGELFIVNGVTSVRDMGGILEEVAAYRDEARKGEKLAPTIYIAGPLVDGYPPIFDDNKPCGTGMSAPVATSEEAIALVDHLEDAGVDLIKLYMMLKPDVFAAAIERAHFHGLKVAGHVPYRMTMQQAIAFGLDGVEHVRGMELGCAKGQKQFLATITEIFDQSNKTTSAMDIADRIHAETRDPVAESYDDQQCAALIKTISENDVWQTPTLVASAFRGLDNCHNETWTDYYAYLPFELRERQLALPEKLTDCTVAPFLTARATSNIAHVGAMSESGAKFLAVTDTPASPFCGSRRQPT